MIENHGQGRFILKLALLLFLCLLLTKQGAQAKGCLRITENSKRTSCDCNLNDLFYPSFEYEVKCREIWTQSTILINFSRDHVEITCFGLDFLDYNLLPQLTESRYTTVRVNHCPLPPRQPIHRIFSKLGLTNVDELEFKSGGRLNRLHFEGLANLGKLSLSSNETSNLPGDLLADLRNLINLDLTNYTNLPLNILFSPVENLETLKLKNNSLHDLPPGIFQYNNKLNHLNLEGNNLINLTKQTFEQLSYIRELDLTSNGIVTFPPDVFLFLPNLRTLTLTGNHIESLPNELFASNKNLFSFVLDENRVQLKRLPRRLFGSLPKLYYLSLNCGLDSIPEDLFVNSTNLGWIDISKNNLTELPLELFADQAKLFILDLSRNQLMSLPDGIFQNTTMLLSLQLSHNHLVTITHNIFSALNSLDRLYLDNNDILAIQSDQFVHTKNLKSIYLQHNKISGELGDLNVSISLRNLRELDLSYNNITAINNFNLMSMDDVPVVNVSHNSIQKVYFNNYKGVILDLSHNPIDCDCELLPFVQFLNSENATYYNEKLSESLDMFQCSYPKNLEGRQVSQLSPNELLCVDKESSSD